MARMRANMACEEGDAVGAGQRSSVRALRLAARAVIGCRPQARRTSGANERAFGAVTMRRQFQNFEGGRQVLIVPNWRRVNLFRSVAARTSGKCG